MFRLSKKVEYAILALQFMSSKQGELCSAKEMSEILSIPYEFLSKSLQILMKKGIVESVQGVRGGYQLSKPADEITINDIITALEDNPSIVECLSHASKEEALACIRSEECSIKNPMIKLQQQVHNIFKNTSLAELSENNLK